MPRNHTDMMQMYRIAKMYYMDGLTQEQIAAAESISRSQISRLLTQARSRGIVEITVRMPERISLNELRRDLIRELKLKDVTIAPLSESATGEETIEAIRNPGIVHFTGHHKPWLLSKFTHHPYASRFWYFALQAPVSWRLKAKILLKRLLTGRLHEPKCQRPWGKADIKKSI